MQKLLIASAVSLAMLTSCSLFSPQDTVTTNFEAEQEWQAVPDPLVTQGTLANGLKWTIKTLPDNGARDRVELRLRIRSGSLQETDSQLGLAHFVEHMAFNGTERFPKHDIVEFFEAAGMSFGGDINAYTSFDETVYQLTIPADQPELIDTAFNVLYDWATAVSFSPDEVAKEAPVVIEEWRSSYGTEEQSWQQEYKDLYQGTRILNRLPIGDPDIVASATAAQLKDYYQTWYRPDNTDVVVVYPEGTFDAEKKIASVFSSWTSEPTAEETFDVGSVDIQGARFMEVTDSSVTDQQWQLYFPVQDFGSDTPLSREVDYLDQVYTTVLEARLQRLGESSDAVIIDAVAQTGIFYEGSKHLDIWATFYEGAENEALAALTTELKRMATYGITEREYDIAKQKMLAEYDNIASWLEGAPATEHMDYLMYFVSEELPMEDIQAALDEAEAMVSVISLEKVNQYIARTILSEHVAGYFYHPNAMTASSAQWNKVYGKAWSSKVSAPVDRAVQTSVNADDFSGEIAQTFDLQAGEGIYIWVLENGMPVVLKSSNLEPGSVTVQTLVLGGTRQLGGELIAASEQWQDARERSGFAGVSGQDFFDSLGVDGISFSPFLHEGFSGVEVAGPVEQLSRLLSLTTATFTDTHFDDAMIEMTLNSSAEQAAQYVTTPDYRFMSEYLAAVYGDEDPRYQYFDQEDIEGIRKEQILAVQESFLNDNQGLLMAIVGDVTPEQVTPLLEEHLAGMPLAEPVESYSLGPVTPEARILRVGGQAEEKTDIRYVFAQTDLPVTPERFVVSQVMVEALDKRLHKAIREESGLTYGTEVFQHPQFFYDQQWVLHVRMSTDPTREAEALKALDKTFQQVLAQPFSETEITEANHRVLEQYKQGASTNGGLLNALTDMMLIGADLTEYNNYEERLARVNSAGVNDLAAKLFAGKKVVAIYHP
ncbi:pitrilysin family protein [Reinekea sp. G2M2-21]|uniref:M16 family metallopeptidase n=1 Tax=Reinekea sp. G2M2-21 TaxID=2788942 RepID=UPI0018AB748D|nr:M16 family metallopeptidase [Reinekea sp. G2M2-21]